MTTKAPHFPADLLAPQEPAEPLVFKYEPAGPVVKAFHRSPAFVRILEGPIGSSKTTACMLEIMRRAAKQRPGRDGKRKTRWAIIRNAYPELRSTTLKSWEQWAPRDVGNFNQAGPIAHRIRTNELDLEVLFLALDREEDKRKLLSLELTGAFVNEAREVPKAIIDTLTGRVGRFPPMVDGGPTWSGIIADTMMPDSDHWLYRFAEESKPDGWQFFRQPGAVFRTGDGWQLNPNAENLANLPKNYYARLLAGKSDDWIAVYLAAEYGFAIDGRPVFPEYRDAVHCSREAFPPNPELPLIIGLDFGLTGAAIFAQRTGRGQWRIIDEMLTEDLSVIRFSEQLAARLDSWYPGYSIEAWGDPSGDFRNPNEGQTALAIVKEYANLDARAAPSNDPTLRREAVAATLNRMVDGEPGMIISPACKTLRKGFAGGYHFKRVQVANDERFHDKANKNLFSHPHDALQYLMLGAGEGRLVMRRHKRATQKQPERAMSDYDVFAYR